MSGDLHSVQMLQWTSHRLTLCYHCLWMIETSPIMQYLMSTWLAHLVTDCCDVSLCSMKLVSCHNTNTQCNNQISTQSSSICSTTCSTCICMNVLRTYEIYIACIIAAAFGWRNTEYNNTCRKNMYSITCRKNKVTYLNMWPEGVWTCTRNNTIFIQNRLLSHSKTSLSGKFGELKIWDSEIRDFYCTH